MPNSQKVSSDIGGGGGEPDAYSLEWQDFTDHQFGAAKPKAKALSFPNEAAARAHLAHLRMFRTGIVATVVPIYGGAKRVLNHSIMDLPRMTKRLTK